ncbi:hypothetical protein AMATHDRAFT_134954 [Amanita thiersii Skay4041]|uniref:Alginate lyase domain-containing protein n=1 Tax=Amanita thiersii Skay4041 TaxID=703135 RepID=A0A2A9P1H4_9AGAR|nr:hypothetical protein AMATHDRAFT_134954 [Amanita thiersii Skay4041]
MASSPNTVTGIGYDKKSSGRNPHGTKTAGASCTPSPSTSMAPSATWTTCPYVVKDGVVNPDVRTLNGPMAINSVSQAVVQNAIAYVLTQSTTYSQNIARFIDTFFLDLATRMNPSIDFGQIVRGPGQKGRSGTFTGILDLSGMVKIVNGIMILRGLGTADWSSARDDSMSHWISQYIAWLKDSSIGRITASRPKYDNTSNHGTFYVAQEAAVQLFTGNRDGAASTLENFFGSIFRDQIAASGEQPFEAVRTRPFHYRCFNLEALIINAKLGDEVGLDLWSSKSKYGATIQTAVDFAMSVKVGNEDITELAPHVAAVAAAYGDSKGKYAAFLGRVGGDYRSKAFWLYDQPEAFSRKEKRAERTENRDGMEVIECPDVFSGGGEIEIDDGVFVTCSDVLPLYNW